MMRDTWVIVGSGSAGGLLAARLSEDPGRDVVLLEKGPDYRAAELPAYARFGYTASSADNPECPAAERGDLLKIAETQYAWYPAIGGRASNPVARGELSGGSSQINAAIYLWGTPADYDEWVSLGNPGWSYEDVRPSFAAIETDRDFASAPHGKRGPVVVRRAARDAWSSSTNAFVAACRTLGHAEVADFNDGAPEGVGPLPYNQERGVRYGTAIAYLSDEVRARPNLRVVGDAEAVRVVLEGRRAVAIEYRRGGTLIRQAGDRIVIAAGSFGSPKLLLRSGIGPADELRAVGVPVVHELAGVGEGLQDHPCISLTWRLREGVVPQLHEIPFQAALRYHVPGSPYLLDGQINVSPVGMGYDASKTFLIDERTVGLFAHLYYALSRGKLCLDPAGIDGRPVINYRYLSDPSDLARMRSIVRHGFAIAAQPAMSEMIADPDQVTLPNAPLSRADAERDETLDAYLLQNADSGQHTSSTCRMGPSNDPLAVVDTDGRVHGLEGLWVIDSSILPTCPRANTNAPTMMVAEHLVRRHLAGR